MEKLKCNICGRLTPVDEFTKRKTNGDGSRGGKGWRYHKRCHECRKKRDRERAKKKREKAKNCPETALKLKVGAYNAEIKRRLKGKSSLPLQCEWPWESKLHHRVCEKCGRKSVHKKPLGGLSSKYCGPCHSGEKNKKPIEPRVVKCKYCGIDYLGKNKNASCPDCKARLAKERERKYRKGRKRTHAQRAKKYGVFRKYNVKAEKVFKRDKWRCKSCNCKVQKNDIYADNAAELDHIIPLSKGGPHTYSNVQTLCRKCNISKGDACEGQLVMHI